MVSEVCPRGKEFLFFAFFGIVGNTSSFVGPFVSAASINASGNDHMPFAFLFASTIVSFATIACVNPQKSRIECSEYLKREQVEIIEKSNL
jgi:MFS-type transporter involved in bile tolerance (Atg22 family)